MSWNDGLPFFNAKFGPELTVTSEPPTECEASIAPLDDVCPRVPADSRLSVHQLIAVGGEHVVFEFVSLTLGLANDVH
jgi:hypothetical protein